MMNQEVEAVVTPAASPASAPVQTEQELLMSPAPWHAGDEMVQVISGEGDFCPLTLKEFLEHSPFLRCGLDYSVVAVLGAQSSGKSTLLNLLFETKFRVLKADVTRERTTHGLWMGLPQRCPTGPASLVVMDVEGTDGNMRQDELAFERKASLFSLAVSSVLIVNLWYNDIGRYNAANLALLRSVFELNMQLFAKAESPKTLILFVIRDHSTTPLEKLQHILLDSMEKIWQEIVKPPEFATSPVTRFFDFSFTSLPHMLLQPDEFEKSVTALRERFLDPADAGFYLRKEYRKQIPSDGFAFFAESIWAAIRENKDLDLPSQRQMLAMVRCEEISEAAYATFDAALAPVVAEVAAGIAKDFGARCGAAHKEVLAEYEKLASRYSEDVSTKKGDGLREKVEGRMIDLFRKQLAHASDVALNNLDARLEALAARPGDRIGGELRAALSETREYWEALARESAVEGLNWRWDEEAVALISGSEKRVAAVRTRLLDASVTEAKTRLSHELSELLAGSLEEALPERMWLDIREAFSEAVERADAALDAVAEAFAADTAEAQLLKSSLRTFAESVVRTLVRTRADCLQMHMDRRFRRIFCTDSKGLPKRWKPRDDISKIYLEARESAELLVDLYGFIKLDPSMDAATFFGEPTAGGGNECPVLDFPRRCTDETCVVIGSDECRSAVEKFRRDSEFLYLTAQRDQETVSYNSRVPPWLFFLMLGLGFNELQVVLFNPIMLFFAILVIVISYIIYMLNLSSVVIAFARTLTSSIARAVREAVAAMHEQQETARKQREHREEVLRQHGTTPTPTPGAPVTPDPSGTAPAISPAVTPQREVSDE